MRLFIDTEFSDFSNLELISVGMVSEDGQHYFYREISDYNYMLNSQFVNEVIVPLLEGPSVAARYDDVADQLAEWLNALPANDIVFIADYPTDFKLVRKLLGERVINKPNNDVMMGAEFMIEYLHRGGHEVNLEAAHMEMLRGCEQYFDVDDRRHHSGVDSKSNRNGWIKGLNYGI